MSDLLILRVTRRFDAPAERVFDAWLDPGIAGKFLFATPDGEMVKVEIDARVGGSFCIVERRDGVDATHYGDYLEIDRPRRLVFSFSVDKHSPSGDRITVEIAPMESGCELTLTHEMKPEWKDYLERTREGWTSIVATLAEILQSENNKS